MKKQSLKIQTFNRDFIFFISILFGFFILGCVTTSQASVERSDLLSTSIAQDRNVHDNNLQANINNSEKNKINNPYNQISQESGILPFLQESFVVVFSDMEENASIIDVQNHTLTQFDPYTTQKFNENNETKNKEKDPSLLNLPHNQETKKVLKIDLQNNEINDVQSPEQLIKQNKNSMLPKENNSQLSGTIPPLSIEIDSNSEHKNHSPASQQKVSPLSQFTVSAFINEKIPIKIEGEGWTLNEDFDTSLEFLQKEYSPNNQSIFYIQAKNPGEYSLLFSRITIGGTEKRGVLLKINPYNSSTAQQKTNIIEENPLSSQTNLNKNKPSNIPESSKEKITPRVIPQKNLTPINSSLETSQQPIDDLLLKSSIPKAKVTTIPNDFKNLDHNSLKELFDESLKRKKTQTDLNTAIKAGQSFIKRFPENIISAKILYELGQLFEEKTPSMDRKTAYNYYQKAFQDYPLSPYSRLSKERMAHLEQFYLRLP